MNAPAPRLLCWTTALLLPALALPGRAEDWFVKGRVYNDVHVIRVNVDTVSVNYEGGTGRLALADLPPELVKRFAAAADDARAFAELQKKAETDAIDHLIVELDPTNGLWRNGPWQVLRESPDARPRDLVAGMRDVRGAKVLEIRPVRIDALPLTAVRVNVASGEEIVLLMYLDAGANGGFWGYRVYPVEL